MSGSLSKKREEALSDFSTNNLDNKEMKVICDDDGDPKKILNFGKRNPHLTSAENAEIFLQSVYPIINPQGKPDLGQVLPKIHSEKKGLRGNQIVRFKMFFDVGIQAQVEYKESGHSVQIPILFEDIRVKMDSVKCNKISLGKIDFELKAPDISNLLSKIDVKKMIDDVHGVKKITEPELVVVPNIFNNIPEKQFHWRFAWSSDISSSEKHSGQVWLDKYRIFIDALNGKILFRVGLINSYWGKGKFYKFTTSARANKIPGGYILKDDNKNLKGNWLIISDATGKTDIGEPCPVNDAMQIRGSLMKQHGIEVDCIRHGRIIMEYYRDRFFRKELGTGNEKYPNKKAMIIECHFDYSLSHRAACCDQNSIKIADGLIVHYTENGVRKTRQYGPFCSLDTLAHEHFHAMNRNEAELPTKYQWGALDEALADAFGFFICEYRRDKSWRYRRRTRDKRWVIGENIESDDLDEYIRSFEDPTKNGSYDPQFAVDMCDYGIQPAHMSQYYQAPDDTPLYDYGGVHVNSGIINKATYLMANGLEVEGETKIYPIPIPVLETLFYYSVTEGMQADNLFVNFKDELLQSVDEFFGDVDDRDVGLKDGALEECRKNWKDTINLAFTEVGIGEDHSIGAPYSKYNRKSKSKWRKITRKIIKNGL